MQKRIWHYRGHRLKQLEWGLWRDVDEPGRYFLCYRPAGRNGPLVRRWTHTGPALSLDQLRQHVRTVRSQIHARKLGITVSVPAKAALGEYLQDMARQNRGPEHIQTVGRACEWFIEATNAEQLEQITVASVERFLGMLHGKGRSANTLNHYRTYLHGWLAWAVRRGYLQENVVERVQRAAQKQQFKPFPTPEQFQAFVDASNRHDGAMWTFLALTGLRRGSFLSLTSECFQKDGILVPHTKRGREWFLSYADGCPLWKPELSDLGRWIWQVRAPTEDYVRFHWQNSRKAAGFDFTLHSLRHAFCSWLAMMGEHVADIAAWAHHASQATTEKWYAHLRPHGQARAKEHQIAVYAMCSHCLGRGLGRKS